MSEPCAWCSHGELRYTRVTVQMAQEQRLTAAMFCATCGTVITPNAWHTLKQGRACPRADNGPGL